MANELPLIRKSSTNRRWIVNFCPATKEAKVVEAGGCPGRISSPISAGAEGPAPRNGNKKKKKKSKKTQEPQDLPRHEPSTGSGRDLAGAHPGFVAAGTQPQAHSDPWLVQHRARRALGHACHSRVLPPRLGTSPLQRDPRYLGKLGLLSCLLRGFNCSVHSPKLPVHPHPPCPADPDSPAVPRGHTA